MSVPPSAELFVGVILDMPLSHAPACGPKFNELLVRFNMGLEAD